MVLRPERQCTNVIRYHHLEYKPTYSQFNPPRVKLYMFEFQCKSIVYSEQLKQGISTEHSISYIHFDSSLGIMHHASASSTSTASSYTGKFVPRAHAPSTTWCECKLA